MSTRYRASIDADFDTPDQARAWLREAEEAAGKMNSDLQSYSIEDLETGKELYIYGVDEQESDYIAAHEGNEDGSNRDVPPFDNDPRTDDQIKQEVYDRLDDDHFEPDGWR